MSTTFLIALLVAIMVVAYWRVALILLVALGLALLATGIGTVSGAIAGQQQPPTVVAPAQPGQGAPDPAPGSDNTGTQSEDQHRTEPGQPHQPTE